MLYTVLLDSNKFLDPMIDTDQLDRLVGELSNETIDNRIEMNNAPRSYVGVFSEPLHVNFPVLTKAQSKLEIPDIAAFEGRLFLNQKAYVVLKDLIAKDGEFISAIYEGGDAFIFTPLRVAENIDALDTMLSKKNEWGDLENLAFHEEKLKEWSVFRASFNDFYTLQCQQSFIDAINKNSLKGLYVTNNLGSIFATERSEVSKLN